MNPSAYLFLAALPFYSSAAMNAEIIKPIPLVAMEKEKALYASVCQAAENSCRDGVKVWHEKGSDSRFYLADASLRLFKIERAGNRFLKKAEWHLPAAAKKISPDDELSQDETAVYPALYPLNKSKVAVAVVTTWSTAYSGGGRTEEYADFIMLNDDNTYQTAFKNIHFSSGELIRACFSEEDYAKNTHCHDESWSVLTIKFIDEGKAYYVWQFNEKRYEWPAFKAKSSASVKISTSIASPFQTDSTTLPERQWQR